MQVKVYNIFDLKLGIYINADRKGDKNEFKGLFACYTC